MNKIYHKILNKPKIDTYINNNFTLKINLDNSRWLQSTSCRNGKYVPIEYTVMQWYFRNNTRTGANPKKII